MRSVFLLIMGALAGIFSGKMLAQPHKLDSLKRVIQTASDRHAQCSAILTAADLCLNQMDIPQAKRYAEQALTLAQNLNDKPAIGKAHYLLGEVYFHKSDYRQSDGNYQTAFFLAKERGDKAAQAAVLNGLGRLYQDSNEPDRAIEKYLEAADIEPENSPKRGRLYINIGNLCRTQGQHGDTSFWKKADTYYAKALAIAERTSDSARIAGAKTSMGRLAMLRGNTQTALAQYRFAMGVARRFHEGGTELACLVFAGEAFLAANKADSAAAYLEKAKAITLKNKDLIGTADIAAMLGKAYLRKNNLGKAAENAALCQQLTDSVRRASGMVIAYPIHYLLDSARGDYASAYRNLRRYTAEHDSIFSAEKARKIADLEARYRSERAERELVVLREAQRLAQWRQWVLAIGLVIAIGVGVWVYRSERTKNRQREALQQQQNALAAAEKRQELLEKQQMEAQLDYKNKELSTFALHIIERTNAFDKVRGEMKEIARQDDAALRKSLVAFIRNLDAQQQLREDVNKFNLYIDDTNKDFFFKLRQHFPSLTQGEERLCTLLRLDLSTNEIAALNGSTPSTIHVSIFRLKKKLGYEERDDMVAFLQSL